MCVCATCFGSRTHHASELPDTDAYSSLLQVICTKVRDGDKRIVRLKEGEPRGRHVVIVDDLVQSGGTLVECQKLLSTQVGTTVCLSPDLHRAHQPGLGLAQGPRGWQESGAFSGGPGHHCVNDFLVRPRLLQSNPPPACDSHLGQGPCCSAMSDL